MKAVMPTGLRKWLVTVQQLTETVGASGFPVETWSTLRRESMHREDMDSVAGRERFTAEQIAAIGETRWQMDYRENMDPEVVDVPKTRRLSYRGRPYNITRASNVGFREAINLFTRTSVG